MKDNPYATISWYTRVMKLQVGVKALIQNDEDKYLFLQRAGIMDNDDAVHWDIPGGRIEPEEPLFDALKREIFEETGLGVNEAPAILGAQDIFVPTKDLHVVRLTYTLHANGAPILSDEHQAFRWMTLDELQEVHLDPYLNELLENKNTPS
jgi:8-oxo-dGTP pyrophosphatase MutT (NUDIX family)